MEQLYKRIEINGDVNRLPKDGDDCFIQYKDGRKRTIIFHDVPDEREFWTQNIEFYLIPVTSPENAVILTEGDIEKEARDVVMNYLTHNNPGGDYKESTIGIDDKRIWWIKGFKYALSKVQRIDLKDVLTKFAKHIASKDFPYAICHGEDKPFVTSKDDFTCKEIVESYLHKTEDK